MNPYVLAALSLTIFGIWGLTSKLAVDAAGWRLAFMTAQMCSAAVGLSVFVALRPRLVWGDMRWAVVTGLLGICGVLAFSIAIERAPASRIVPITAMYPAVTVLLSWLFLNEQLTGRHVLGVVFALAGVMLLA